MFRVWGWGVVLIIVVKVEKYVVNVCGKLFVGVCGVVIWYCVCCLLYMYGVVI